MLATRKKRKTLTEENNNIIQFSKFVKKNKGNTIEYKPFEAAIPPVVLTSHQYSFGNNKSYREDNSDKKLLVSSFEITVDKLMTAWYNGDLRQVKTHILDLYIEHDKKQKENKRNDSVHR